MDALRTRYSTERSCWVHLGSVLMTDKPDGENSKNKHHFETVNKITTEYMLQLKKTRKFEE